MKNDDTLEIRHSKANMSSYGFAKALTQFAGVPFSTFGFFYYETELGLNVWLIGIGLTIFAIWNAINDPLVGYLTNRPFSFTRNWGRRFPWIMFGGVAWVFSLILVFSPPNVDPESGALILLSWLIFSTCLTDTFASIFFVNFSALFADKFRSVEERRTATGIQTAIGFVGVALGVIVPPLFITFGDRQSYSFQAIMVAVIGVFMLAISIPGCREDQALIDRYLLKHDDTPRESFFKSMKVALKHKSFIAFVLTYTLYQSMVNSIQASVPYVASFLLGIEASSIILISAGFMIGGIVSIPFWVKLARKTNDNRKTMLVSCIFLTIVTIPLIFIDSYIGIVIAMTITGLGFGGTWLMLSPILADTIDEAVVKEGKREEGIYNGMQQFFGQFAVFAQSISFAVVHSLTGFVEGASTQTATAVWGIQVHFGLVPTIFMVIATIVFWKWYGLTSEKVKANQEMVKELGL